MQEYAVCTDYVLIRDRGHKQDTADLLLSRCEMIKRVAYTGFSRVQ